MNIGGSKIIKKSANLVMQYIRKDAERILITYLIDLRRGKFFFHSGDQSRKSRIILHFPDHTQIPSKSDPMATVSIPATSAMYLI